MECLFCIRRCFGMTGQTSFSIVKEHCMPKVVLDTSTMGNDVVIVKNGHRICGSGGAIANAPIVQNKAYFEVKVQQTGIWGIGLATSQVNLNNVPLAVDSQSWVLRNDGRIFNDNRELFKLTNEPQEGDVVGVAFDHIDLMFHINNKSIEHSITNIKGNEIFPVVYVDEGAILDVSFTTFQYEPPQGFDRILIEKSLL